MDDQRIIELFFARDEQAIRAVSDKYGDYCAHVAMRILGDFCDAEECVNTAYLTLWNTIPPARPTVLRTFLGRLVRNESINRHRANRRRRRDRGGEVSLDAILEEAGDCFPANDDTDALKELPALLDAFLRGQDSLDRKLFVGRYYHAYKVADMAAHYGITAQAASMRLYRTRERLRAYLKERGIEV